MHHRPSHSFFTLHNPCHVVRVVPVAIGMLNISSAITTKEVIFRLICPKDFFPALGGLVPVLLDKFESRLPVLRVGSGFLDCGMSISQEACNGLSVRFVVVFLFNFKSNFDGGLLWVGG